LTPELAGREQADIRSTPVDFIYADEAAFAEDPTLRSRLDELLSQGWRRVAPASPSSWMLLERQGPASGP
jgi:hypothetical protein